MRKQPKEKPLKTVEDLHQEWRDKLKFYRDLFSRMPIADPKNPDHKMVVNKILTCQRMVDLIEKHLL